MILDLTRSHCTYKETGLEHASWLFDTNEDVNYRTLLHSSFACRFDDYAAHIKVDEYQIRLPLWDTAAQGNYERLRALSYPDTVSCVVETISYQILMLPTLLRRLLSITVNKSVV